MADSLIGSLFNMIDSRTVEGIAASLGAGGDSVNQGLKSSIASVLGGLVSKSGDPAALRSMLDLAPSSEHPLEDVANAAYDTNSPLLTAGPRILSSLFGNKTSAVTEAVAAQSGLRSGSASTILSMAAPMVMGFLSRLVTHQGLSMSGLGGLLQRESGAIRGFLPAGLANMLLPATATPGVPVAAQAAQGQHASRWLPLLLLAILVPGILWLVNQARKPSTPAVAPAVNGTLGTANRSIEERNDLVTRGLLANADLKFNTGSATIQPESQVLLDNMAAILKKYPDTRVKVTGYTDSTGNAEQNMRLSEERADAVVAGLVRRGVSPARLTAEGRGEQNSVLDDVPGADQAKRRVSLEVMQP